MGANVPLPVLYIHEGAIVLTGSAVGKVGLWNAATGLYLHSLDHGGMDYISNSVCF
jgi:hypothetical protein